jgi:hypothetical protein
MTWVHGAWEARTQSRIGSEAMPRIWSDAARTTRVSSIA